jgi:lauroyl/myristoyl acyltransferase
MHSVSRASVAVFPRHVRKLRWESCRSILPAEAAMSLAVLKLRLARGLERCLPPGPLAALLWPAVAVGALVRALGPHGRAWRNAVGDMHAGRPGILAAWRHFRDELFLMLAASWPDRWLGRRWAGRFHVTGLEEVQRLLAAGTPVVIAVVHFTHLSVLRYLLRARGIPAASLSGFLEEHPTLGFRDTALDRVAGLEGVPNRFFTAGLRSAYDFLRSGNCLIMACDVATAATVAVTTDLGTLDVAVGPFRVAQMTGAVVVPAILWESGRWRFEARFGEPFSPAGDADRPETFRPCAERCMQHWLPVMQSFPTQYDGGLGRVWRPQTTRTARLSQQAADT